MISLFQIQVQVWPVIRQWPVPRPWPLSVCWMTVTTAMAAVKKRTSPQDWVQVTTLLKSSLTADMGDLS